MAAESFSRWLNKKTVRARIRGGYSMFYYGSMPLSDRAISWLFYTLSTRHWFSSGQRSEHLYQLQAGLERCRTPMRVLDLGTGAGSAAAECARRWPTATVVGVDMSGRMVRRARKAYIAPNLSYQRGRAERLPFPDDSFDLCTLMNAGPEMNELRRVMKPGGQVLNATRYSRLPREDSAWVARWGELGFTRIETGTGEGHWEVYELDVELSSHLVGGNGSARLT